MSDISDLFAKDPLDLTTEDLDKIIAEYRDRRNQFKLTGKAPSAKKIKAPAESVEAAKNIDLGGLGL